MTDPKILYRTIEEIRLLVAEAGLASAKESGDTEMHQIWIDRIHEHQNNFKNGTF